MQVIMTEQPEDQNDEPETSNLSSSLNSAGTCLMWVGGILTLMLLGMICIGMMGS